MMSSRLNPKQHNQTYEVPDTPPATSLEPVSSELKNDGTRMTSAQVNV
jgi:hypothetical protein